MLNRLIKNKLSLIILIIFCACKKDNTNTITVSLEKYKKLKMKEDYLSVILIKSFPNDISCSGRIKNSNLYLCEITETGDTILLFEPCLKMPDYAKNDFSGERDLEISKKNIVKENIEKINVIVGNDSIFLNKDYKYLLGSFTYLVY